MRRHLERAELDEAEPARRPVLGLALRLGDEELKELLDDGIAQADGAAWRCWLPSLPYPPRRA